jgi:MurNAc alpha-1-phosphate uridylyltransferase
MFKNLMIFAAGYGSRMLPLSELTAKPLIKIHGKPILYYNLEQALAYPFEKIVINIHYLAEQLEEAIMDFISLHPIAKEKIIISREQTLLDTGGGIKYAQKYFDEDIIFTLNSDSLIVSQENPFYFLARSWQKNMSALMIVQDINQATGYRGRGDFFMDKNQRLQLANGPAPFVYTGLQLIDIRNVLKYPEDIFSLSKMFGNDNVYGLLNSGDWYHLTVPEDIINIENKFNV